MNLVLTKQGLLHMELLLLENFHWNIYLPTAAHFIEYYLSVGVSETDLHDGWPMACLEKTVLYMNKYADYFLEVSLQGKVDSLHNCVEDVFHIAVFGHTKHYSFFFFFFFNAFLFLDHAFLRFAPSLVATACVASSRVILHLAPTWPPRLQRLSAYTWEQLLPCVERLLLWVTA